MHIASRPSSAGLPDASDLGFPFIKSGSRVGNRPAQAEIPTCLLNYLHIMSLGTRGRPVPRRARATRKSQAVHQCKGSPRRGGLCIEVETATEHAAGPARYVGLYRGTTDGGRSRAPVETIGWARLPRLAFPKKSSIATVGHVAAVVQRIAPVTVLASRRAVPQVYAEIGCQAHTRRRDPPRRTVNSCVAHVRGSPESISCASNGVRMARDRVGASSNVLLKVHSTAVSATPCTVRDGEQVPPPGKSAPFSDMSTRVKAALTEILAGFVPRLGRNARRRLS